MPYNPGMTHARPRTRRRQSQLGEGGVAIKLTRDQVPPLRQGAFVCARKWVHSGHTRPVGTLT